MRHVCPLDSVWCGQERSVLAESRTIHVMSVDANGRCVCQRYVISVTLSTLSRFDTIKSYGIRCVNSTYYTYWHLVSDWMLNELVD